MDNVATVEINGTEYYVASDYLQYLIVVDNHLVNVGTTTINLYHTFRESGVNNSGYPRISVASMSYATIQNTYNSTSSTLSVNSYEVMSRVTPTNTFLLIAIVVVLIFNWFKGR